MTMGMQQSTKLLLRTVACLAMLGAHLAALAVELPISTSEAAHKHNPIQQASDLPALESAVAEIERLKDRISAIESGYEKICAEARQQVNEQYGAQLVALDKELPDQAETAANFDALRVKRREELNAQRNAALARLTPSSLAATETAPLHSRIGALEDREYVVGLESLEVELGEYDNKEQQYSIRVRSKTPVIHLRLKGSVPLPRADAKIFQQQWLAGLVRPEAKIKLSDDSMELDLINAADNTRMTNLDGVFMTAIKRQEKFELAYRPAMIVIPAGEFNMGSNENLPVHRVTITKGFAISKTEVTQKQWRALMGKDPIHINNCGNECPVDRVSWNDAHAFIQQLNAKTGKQYRLPSEAEWEYACRAGEKQEFCGGNDVDSVAWYSRNSGSTTHPVATKKANAFGLYDMSGNVWEWVEDGYQNNINGVPADGSSWQGNDSMHVVRGGSRSDDSPGVRMTARDGFEPEYRFNGFGFRLAQTLP
jgi:formylglycine-generating enzyme required for sulfatase activity